MKLIVLISTFYFSISLHAQEGFSASRGQALGTAGSSSYTVGQTVYYTYTGSTGSVAQGIQQTYDITALLGAEISAIKLELVAYPNPIQETLTLKINNYKNEKANLSALRYAGQIMGQSICEGSAHSARYERPSGRHLFTKHPR